MTTGYVPRKNAFEKLTGKIRRATTLKDGKTVPDELDDDLSLIFHLSDDTVVILAGCCHAGIVNTAHLTTKLIQSKKIIGIIGGLHLHDASEERLEKTVQELKKYPISKMAACHCTGLRGKFALYQAFYNQFMDIGVGSTIKFVSGN